MRHFLYYRQNIVRRFDKRCSLLDELIGALASRIHRRARHRKYFAPLFHRKPRRNQRTRFERRLDNHRAARDTRDNAIASRKTMRMRNRAQRMLTDDRALLANLLVKI